MRFTCFGVRLERLERKHLELVRQWRNSDWVRPYMRYRSVIDPEDQIRWFENMDPLRNWYFVAHVEDLPFALFHVKSIDARVACGESGGFVGAPRFIGRPEAAQATLALMDFAFLVLRLRSLEAHYSSSLPKIVSFNQKLGYRVLREESDGFIRARVTEARYFRCAAEFRKAAMARCGATAVLVDPAPHLADTLKQSRTASPDLLLLLQ